MSGLSAYARQAGTITTGRAPVNAWRAPVLSDLLALALLGRQGVHLVLDLPEFVAVPGSIIALLPLGNILLPLPGEVKLPLTLASVPRVLVMTNRCLRISGSVIL